MYRLGGGARVCGREMDKPKFKNASGRREPKTDWSHRVTEAAAIVYAGDRQVLGLDVPLWGMKRNDLAGICN